MKRNRLFLLFILAPLLLFAQKNETKSKLNFSGDFRFRIEQDWNSRMPDSTFRKDRTRLRYRARFGASYDYNEAISFGIRLRTGNPKKQQDPHLTLGDGFKEFGTLPIAFEKLYAQYKYNWFLGWVGKNTFPFKKQNELFWSDNVYPEGVAVQSKFDFKNENFSSIEMNAGHFILASQGSTLGADSYVLGIQIATNHFKDRLQIFPGFFYFNKTPNIPDGNETFTINYAISHFGMNYKLFEKPIITIGVDYYQNLENYNDNDSILEKFRNQKQGFVSAICFGKLKNKGDWTFHVTHTYLERFAAVDFLAQNDWARWDYSSVDSPDGRLTNFKGIEIMAGYAIGKNMNLKMRAFSVDQLLPFEKIKENGNRIRFDFNIGF